MDSGTAVESSIINGYFTEDLVNSGLELQPANAEGSKEAEAACRTGCRPTAPSQSTADSLGTVLLHAVATKASNRREVAVGLKAGCLTQGSKGAPTGGRPMRGRAKMAPPLPTLWECASRLPEETSCPSCSEPCGSRAFDLNSIDSPR